MLEKNASIIYLGLMMAGLVVVPSPSAMVGVSSPWLVVLCVEEDVGALERRDRGV